MTQRSERADEEAAPGRMTGHLALQKTSKNSSIVAGIESRVVAEAESAIEEMTFGGTIPWPTVVAAVAALAGLVYPRPILDVLAVVVLAVVVMAAVGLRRLLNQIWYVYWATPARVTAGVTGREYDDKMGLWGGQYLGKVLYGIRVQGALGAQEEWGVDSVGLGGARHQK